MLPNLKISNHSLITIAVLALIFIGLPLYYIFHSSGSSGYQTKMLFSDSPKGQMFITDKNGSQLSKIGFPKLSYPTVQASSAKGNLLISLNASTEGELDLMLQGAVLKQLPEAASQVLSQSIIIGTSHQWFFNGDNSVLTVICPNPDTSCTIVSVDLNSGAKKQIADLGVKQTSNFNPTAYLVGVSTDNKTAFVRLNAANKLGKLNSAIYQVEISSGKALHATKTSEFTSFAMTLSPDKSKVVYQQLDTKGKSTLRVMDLATGHDQSVDFSLGTLQEDPSALGWSPDSRYVLVQTQAVLTAPDSKEKPTPVKTAYLDTKSNNLINLQTISNPQILIKQGWIDSKTIVYQTKNGNELKTVKQKLSGSSGELKTPSGDLVQSYQVAD